MKRDNSIFIKNIYYMLSYAFTALKGSVYEDVRTDRFSSLDISLREYADRAFSEADALVFVGACGIAVRCSLLWYCRRGGSRRLGIRVGRPSGLVVSS